MVNFGASSPKNDVIKPIFKCASIIRLLSKFLLRFLKHFTNFKMVFGLLLLFGFCASSLAIGLSPEERTACTRGKLLILFLGFNREAFIIYGLLGLICGVNKDQLDFFAIGDTGGWF